jgi:CPA2 family monovalent cation:H+ antiporter-2
VEVVARLLRSLEVPRNVIEEVIQDARAGTQSSERKQTLQRSYLGELRGLAELKIESVLVRERSPLEGASPVSMRLRTTTGVLVVGVRRGSDLLQDFEPTMPFEAGDVVYFVGTGNAIRQALPLFEPT